MERDHDLIADVYGGHGINRGKDNVRMPSEHQLDRRRREVLTIDPEPVAGTAGEVEEALRVPVAEIAGPVDAVAHAFGVGFGIVVITLEATAAVGVHDLAD